MIKRAGMFTAVLAAVAVVAAVGVWWYREQTGEETVPPTAVSQPYRIVGEWEGQVAVFLPEGDTPETVYDTPLAALPEEERERLAAGIDAADRAALARLLEDYLS